MKQFPISLATLSLLFLGSAALIAQNQAAYLDPALPPEQRAADLVHRLTVEEKASQLVNHSRAIPRLNIPVYDWWSEALHGVAVKGVTAFPEPVGLASTFDTPLIHAMGEVIGTEGRIIHNQAVREGKGTLFFHGLDFWAPNLNIFRDPRWGRGQETYGEDPYLTGRMGVAFVTGMQGDDPKYYRVIATPKHFAVHSGPEPTRHFADVDVSKHDQMDTYLPAFRAAVTEGHAGSVMCAYNAVNGQPACANEFTLVDQLRNKWGFQGYVVSDCSAVVDIFTGHHYRATQPQSSAISLLRGMDNECITSGDDVKGDGDYHAYIDAMQQGYLPESAVDQALVRLFTARIKLGMMDAPGTTRYSNIDEKELASPAHREMARKIAEESMVLLKNDGTLPLKSDVKKIAVVGPLADQTKVLLGNYNGYPEHTVSLLEGLKAEFPNAEITYEAGTQFLHQHGDAVPAALLTTAEGKPGLTAEYGQRLHRSDKPEPITSRIEANVDLSVENLPVEAKNKKPLSVQWSGFLTPEESGDYLLGIHAHGFASVTADDSRIVQQFGEGSRMGRVHLVKGRKVAIKVNFGAMEDNEKPFVQLIWSKVENGVSAAALEAARNADVVIAAVGITSELEGEEMPVTEPGFLGGDRTSIDLPEAEEKLVQEVAAIGKPLVVVLMNGSALAVNWEKDHANAILEAWYSGEEGGTAIAETLKGKINPAGRLPVTFYTGVEQLPHFEDYSMNNRTYRYFHGKPLYPFGYGLSYAKFAYRDLDLPRAALEGGASLQAEVTVANTGAVAGDEVVQLYLSFPSVPGAPLRALRGFKRVHLDAGQTLRVHFSLSPRDLGMVSEAGEPMVAEGKYSISIGGGQPETGVPTVVGSFEVKSRYALPE